jgi:excisionase family DNA binding protein
MLYTLGQAAKATGKSKPTLSRAIKNGVISAHRQDDGSYLIDPAELHRVFEPVVSVTPVTGNETGNMKQDVTPCNPQVLQAQNELLREMVRLVEKERDDLRQRLDHAEAARGREAEERDKAAAEIRRLTLLITHQPKASVSPQEPQKLDRGWNTSELVTMGIISALIAFLGIVMLQRQGIYFF